MFHPINLVTGGILEPLWKAGHNIASETRDEEYNLPKICRSLDSWICSDALREDRRLSLRTSATLISGVAKLYKSSLCKLLDDVRALDENITYRKRRRTNTSSSSSTCGVSEYAASPEQMRREVVQDFETSFSLRKRAKSNSSSTSNTKSYSISKLSADSISTNVECCTHSETTPELSSNQSNEAANPVEDSTAPVNLSDQGVQTSPATYRPEGDDSSDHDWLDKDLPYAYILVHDSYRSMIPNKIILSSITSDVSNLN